MPRNTVDTCFICGGTPCECSKKAKPPKQVKPAKPKPEPQVETPAPQPTVQQPRRKSFVEAMKAAAEQAPAKPVTPVRQVPVVPKVTAAPQVSDEELLFGEAIRALEPLLAYEDKQKFSMVLGYKPGPAERVRIWKARRRAEEVLGQGDERPPGE